MTDSGDQQPTQDLLDDVRVSLSHYSEPTLASALLIRRELNERSRAGFSQAEFETKFPPPRRLDVGSGEVREPGWIALDYDPRNKPHLLVDAHAIPLADSCVNEVRAVRSLSTMTDPEQVLREIWRVLVPNGVFIVVEGAPGSDETKLPRVKHEFVRSFWTRVSDTHAHLYVPVGANGRWDLQDLKFDLNQIGSKMTFKFKLTWEQVVDTFRNVARTQRVRLVKRVH